MRSPVQLPRALELQSCVVLCTKSLQVVRWDIIGAIDIATEVALFAMAILLVKDLKMDISKKTFVVVAFGLRLPYVYPLLFSSKQQILFDTIKSTFTLLTNSAFISMIAVTILRLQAASTWAHASDPTLSGVFFIIWSIVEAHFSICSSNIACLKPFIAAFNTSFGGSAEINELSRMDRSKAQSGGSSTLNSMKNQFRRNKGDKKSSSSNVLSSNHSVGRIGGGDRGGGSQSGVGGGAGGGMGSRRGQEMGNDVDIIHEDTGSVGSGGSRQMIIQKDVTWDVEYSTPKPGKFRLGGGGGSQQ